MIRLPVLSLALLSASTLAYELLLMRLFSIIHWHHFAYMVIGLALLGHGFSGSVVVLLQARLLMHFRRYYLASILSFSLLSIFSFLWTQSIPFNAEEMLWDWRQSFYLLIIFLFLSLPFFCSGFAICLSLLHYKQRLSRLYAADLLGAGIGCMGFIIIMYWIFPQTALFYIGLMGLLTAMVAALELQCFKPRLGLIVLLLFVFIYSAAWDLKLQISPYKSLPQMQRIKGTRVLMEKSNPLGVVTVLSSEKVPIRYVPGMSLSTGSEPLSQLAVFSDADNMSVITRQADDLKQLDYLDQITSSVAYHLTKSDQVLVIGSGSGNDILQAQFHQSKHIDAVELNELYIEMTELKQADFVSNVYQQPNVKVHIADGRDFLNSRHQQYDLIQLNLLDSFNASAAGLYALNESYLYTVEALELYLSSLNPEGYLSITRWLKMPPRDSLKLFNTALTVLRKQGRGNAAEQIVLIRSWQTATLIIKKTVFSDQEIKQVENFARQRNFDLVYSPRITPAQVNRFNVLAQPLFYNSVHSLLSENRQQFIDSYKFNLQPATDDRPYFQHFFRWSSFAEMFSLLHKGGASLIETGYLIVFATFCIAVISSIVLILGPLLCLKQHSIDKACSIKPSHVFAYFFAIGLGFLMIEIAFMQKFILFLHHPVFSAAAILTSFLVFAGVGSASSVYLSKRYGLAVSIKWGIICLLGLSLIYLLSLAMVFSWASGLSMLMKFLLAVFLIAPLAFLMGMPMPLALSSLAKHAEYMIPWAWGINGCASVISSVLAALLAMQFGFSVVILVALIMYMVAMILFPKPIEK